MTKYKWLCACGIWIETDTEFQMDNAKDRHYKKHVKQGDVSEQLYTGNIHKGAKLVGHAQDHA